MLKARVAELKKCHAHNFDPIGFCYIESLLRRAIGKKIAVAGVIEQKALKALKDYTARLDNARSKAHETVTQVSAECPDVADDIRSFYEKCEFKRVKQVQEKYCRRTEKSPISELINYMQHKTGALDHTGKHLSMDDLLQKQETEIIQSLEDRMADTGSRGNLCQPELKSYQFFKVSLAKHQTDTRVTRAIRERPENPGPLNSQMLAIRALSTMRNLSPGYLNRFVSYLDTLFWLESIT